MGWEVGEWGIGDGVLYYIKELVIWVETLCNWLFYLLPLWSDDEVTKPSSRKLTCAIMSPRAAQPL